MSTPYPFPGMAHVPAPTDSPTPTAAPATTEETPEARRIALDLAVRLASGRTYHGNADDAVLQIAKGFTRYLMNGTISDES